MTGSRAFAALLAVALLVSGEAARPVEVARETAAQIKN